MSNDAALLDAIAKAREETGLAAAGCAAVLDSVLWLLPAHMKNTREHAAECVLRYKVAEAQWSKLVSELTI